MAKVQVYNKLHMVGQTHIAVLGDIKGSGETSLAEVTLIGGDTWTGSATITSKLIGEHESKKSAVNVLVRKLRELADNLEASE